MAHLEGTSGRRPLVIGHVLRDMLRVLRRHMSTFVLILFLGHLPSILASGISRDEPLQVPASLYQIPAYLAAQLGLWLPLLFAAAMTGIIGVMQLAHREPAYRFAIRRTQQRAIVIAAGSVLEVGAFMLMTLLFMLPEIFELGGPQNGLVTAGIGAAFCALPAAALLLWFSLYLPIAAIEKHGVFQSLRRSWNLTAGNRWKVLLLTGSVAAAHGLILWTPHLSVPAIHPAAAFCLTHLLILVVVCFRSTMQAALYHNLRQIKDQPLTALDFYR